MDPGYRYGGEAAFLIGVGVRIMSWLIRTSREIQDDDRSPLPSLFSPDQRSRAMAMIADPPRVIAHRCPQCGTLIHADIVHGGFGPCRKCGWSPSSQPSAAAS